METSDEADIILIKYGGNAMLSEALTAAIANQIKLLQQKGYAVVVVHGGGPFIQKTLDMAGIKSDFAGGHRITTPEAMQYIEMALKGQVNGHLVNVLKAAGLKPVGLSGKDGQCVEAGQRLHTNEQGQQQDIGLVGDVKNVNTLLPLQLLKQGFTPVFAPIAYGSEHPHYNINADMFAGHLAGALQAKYFVLLTDVDGLMEDPAKPDTLIRQLRSVDIAPLRGNVIKGGMLPKTEACQIALNKGASHAVIANGTKPEQLADSIFQTNQIPSTVITQ